MLYLYYNARTKRTSEITRISYDLKLGAPRREMAEGDMVFAAPKALVMKMMARRKRTGTARKATRRAKSTVQV